MKSILALALACFAAGAASTATAQVGLGGGVVGTLGANGSASRFGGIGSGISTGTTLRGEELRQTGQLSAETRGQALPPTSGNAGGAANIDTTIKPGGANADVKAGGGASASTPMVNGSAWGSASAPDTKETMRDTKAAARHKADKIEDHGDKAADKALQ